MSVMRRGQQLHPDELTAAPLPPAIAWEDYAAIMRAVLRDPATPDVEERLRLTYALMDLADVAGLSDVLA